MIPLSVPPLLAAAVEIAFVLYVLAALPEPPRPPSTLRAVLRDVPATIADGLRLGGRDVLVRRVLLSAAAAGSALATIELLTPGRAAAFTGAPESGAMLFAALACAGFVCSGIGSHLAPLTARLAGSGERAVLVSLGTSASGLLLLSATAATTGPASMALRLPDTAWCTSVSARRDRARTTSCTAESQALDAPRRCPFSPSPCN